MPPKDKKEACIFITPEGLKIEAGSISTLESNAPNFGGSPSARPYCRDYAFTPTGMQALTEFFRGDPPAKDPDAKKLSHKQRAAANRARKQLKAIKAPKYLVNGRLEIKNVIFNDPATIVFWSDGSKTVVQCQPGDTYSKETGLALAIAKRACGNTPRYNKIFKKWVTDDE